MTDTRKPYSKTTPRSIARDNRFVVRLSDDERDRVESDARNAGFGNASDYVRDRLFGEPSGGDVRDQQRVDGEMLDEQQRGEVAVAVLHLYDINQQAFMEAGRKEWFDEGRRVVIANLGLDRLFGAEA